MWHRPTRLAKVILLLGLCLLPLMQGTETGVLADDPPVDLEVFVRTGCPHCEKAKTFLHELQRERPSLRIVLYDIADDQAARQRLAVLSAERGMTSIGVPSFLIGGDLLVGFRSGETTGKELRARLDRLRSDRVESPPLSGIETAWFGEVRVSDVGLPLFTVVVGLLDGFNPCAMWVLLFLLSLLVNLRDRLKMALIAGTFVAVSGLVYFAFMAAWLNLFLLIGLSRTVQIGLGGIALLVGVIHVKDFFAFRRGVSLSIPEAAKPGLYGGIRAVLQADNLVGAFIAVVILAGLVNVVELLCTAGFPALYTQILTLQQLPTWKYYAYLGLYNMAYVFDDGLMVTVAVVTLSRTRLQESAGRWLKLISGGVMAGLGGILLLAPEWLI